MSIINIAPVTRSGMRYIMNFYGMSESGKTLSALKIMAGLEPNPAKRGMLDTEGGQRGRAFVDHVPGGYLYGALTAPFTPERYIEAISAFEEAGCSVLTIDSVSHAWFAAGGVLDMVESATEKNDMAKWKKPKRRLGKMTQRIMHSDMHILLCSRAKQPLVKDSSGQYVPGPVVPIQEKTLRYDMTIIAHMLGDGKFTIDAPAGKCPGALRPIFKDHGVMDTDMGQKMAAWIQAEQTKTPAQRLLETSATTAAEGGTDAFRDFWKKLDKSQRAMLQPMLDNYQSIATSADEEAKRQADAEREAANEQEPPPDEPFGKPTLVVGHPSPSALANETATEMARAGTLALRNWLNVQPDAVHKAITKERMAELLKIAAGADQADQQQGAAD